jgi:glutathione-regulated potassium-efflux system ancillary protein KefG
VARILVLFAHPALEKSRIQVRLLDAAAGVAGVTVHDLYEAYPDFDVDVAAEQSRLGAADVLVVQHPLYWYSTPALLKEWQDLVLEHGWAYGRDGTALRGKAWLSAISAGGGASAYGPDGINRHPVRHFLAPLEQTARLCGMRFLPPFVVHGTHAMDAPAIAARARDYARLLAALRDDRIALGALDGLDRLPDDLDAVLPASPEA